MRTASQITTATTTVTDEQGFTATQVQVQTPTRQNVQTIYSRGTICVDCSNETVSGCTHCGGALCNDCGDDQHPDDGKVHDRLCKNCYSLYWDDDDKVSISGHEDANMWEELKVTQGCYDEMMDIPIDGHEPEPDEDYSDDPDVAYCCECNAQISMNAFLANNHHCPICS